MGRTNTGKKQAAATKPKGNPKKAASVALNMMKQSIELVAQNNQKQSQSASSSQSTAVDSVAVDSHVDGASHVQVVVHEGQPLSVYLNFAEMKVNHNKFYIMQVLQEKSKSGTSASASLYTRYGRVGVNGVKSCVGISYQKAVAVFKKTMRQKMNKGYTEIKMAGKQEDKNQAPGGIKGAPKAQVSITQPKMPESKLAESVQTLMKFFFDEKLMEQSIVKINVDVKRMPLGQLSQETVLKGYAILRNLEDAISKNQTSRLPDLSGQFYTNIPHNFGMQKMSSFVIKNMEMVKEKYDLITALLDIQIANKILEKGREDQEEAKLVVNPVDSHYAQLKCDIWPLLKSNKAYQMISLYVQNTGEGQLEIVDCFEIKRQGEAEVFNPQNLGNKKLLWHGSRFSNFPGILSQGMRIAPPEAPRSGFLFGKGVYFADLIGKSFHYTRPSISGGIGTFVLCEVALGNQRPLTRPDCNADHLPSGMHSTHALGTRRPKPGESVWMPGGVEVPLGRVESYPQGGMGANEFVVYNTNQIRMRYIVRCKNK